LDLKVDATTKEETLVLTLPPANGTCTSGSSFITYEITCDANQTIPKITNDGQFDEKSCTNTIKMTSSAACRGEKFSAWYKHFGVSKYVVGTTLGLLGIFFIFFGATYFKVTSSIIVAFCSGIIIKSLLSPYYQLDLLVALCIGIVLAILLSFSKGSTNTVLAIIVGYFIGTIMYNFVVKIFDMDPNTLYMITILGSICLAILFAFIIDNLIVIVTTSLIGGYLALRGLSICLGGFPDETYTSQLILNREFNQLGRVFGGDANLYLLGMLVMFVLGLSVQASIAKSINGDEVNEEKKPDEKVAVVVDDKKDSQKLPEKQPEETDKLKENQEGQNEKKDEVQVENK